MTRRLYTEEQHAFIQANTQGRTARQLSSLVEEKLGIAFTPNMAKSYRANHHLQSGPVEDREMYSSLFPKEICVYIRENYKGCGPKEMAERVAEYERSDKELVEAAGHLACILRNKLGVLNFDKNLTMADVARIEERLNDILEVKDLVNQLEITRKKIDAFEERAQKEGF